MKQPEKRFVLSEKPAFDFIISSLACAVHNLTLMFPVGLIYSFIMYMLLLCGTGYDIQHHSSVFYLSTGFVCAFLILFSSWLKYSTTHMASYHTAQITGSIISTIFMVIALTFIDWRMSLSASWVLPVSCASTWLSVKVMRSELWRTLFIVSSYLVLRLGIVSVAMTGAFLYAHDSLSANIFIIFLLTASRLYDPLEVSLQNLAAHSNVERIREMK